MTVPGGRVVIDPYRGRSALGFWLKMSLSFFWRSSYAPQRAERDIVVMSEDGRELYREGPYNAITVVNPLNRVVEEINHSGLARFLRARHIESSQIGPISRPGRVGLWRQITPYWGKNRSDP